MPAVPTIDSQVAGGIATTVIVASTLVLLSGNALAQHSEVASKTQTAVDDVSLVGLLELEVVAPTLTAQSASEAAAVIEVITAEQIQERGYHTVAEALGSLAGLDVTSDHYQYNLGVRGISGGKHGWSRVVKVMLDGQPVAFRPSGENFLGTELIPIGLVERIEVIRGPASALYGANAFLGVVNIVTRRAESLDGAAVAGGLESGPRVRSYYGEVLVGQQIGRLSFSGGVTAETRDTSGYRIVPLPGYTHPAQNEYSQGSVVPSGSAYGGLSYAVDRTSQLSLDLHLQKLDTLAEMMDWGPVNHRNRLSLVNSFARLSYEKEFSQTLRLFTSLAGAGGGPTKVDRLATGFTPAQHVERDVGYKGADLRVLLDYHWDEKNSALGGFDYTFDAETLQSFYTYSDSGTRVLNPPGGMANGVRRFTNFGAYLQTIAYPVSAAGGGWRGLGTTIGARYDNHNRYGEAWNGRAGVVYNIGTYYVKVLGGTSFRAPTATQLYSNSIGSGGTIGNPRLRPERARTVEFAFGGAMLPQLAVRTNAFYTRVEDRVEYREVELSSASTADFATNSTPIESFGGEGQVDLKLSRLQLFANYAYQNSSYEREDLLALERQVVSVATDLYPTHMAKGGATVRLPEIKLLLSAEARYTGARLGFLRNNAWIYATEYLNRRYELPAYTLCDISLSTLGIELWRGRETRVGTKVRNVFGERYTLPGYNRFDLPGFETSVSIWAQQEL